MDNYKYKLNLIVKEIQSYQQLKLQIFSGLVTFELKLALAIQFAVKVNRI